MKKKIIKVLSAIVLSTMVLSSNTFGLLAATGATGNGVTKVSKGGIMNQAVAKIPRSGMYSYVEVGVTSVFPINAQKDTYTKCKTRLYDSKLANVSVSDTYIITEGTIKKVNIKEGKLSIRLFDLCFAGNNPNYEAGVAYQYDAK